MIKYIAFIIALLFSLTACNSAIKPEELYGKWKYTKVEHPRATPPDTLSSAEITAAAPYIRFSQNNKLVMMWDNKVLSQGKFILDGHNIVYTENLPDGKTRTFPFWVSELTGNELVFETQGDDGSRVTAVKESH